jgi:hypothetical protein
MGRLPVTIRGDKIGKMIILIAENFYSGTITLLKRAMQYIRSQSGTFDRLRYLSGFRCG